MSLRLTKWVGVMLLGVMAGIATSGVAQQKGVAGIPPMGWNSWDAYGLTITEAQFRANVEVFAKRLKPAGYEYVVIDEGWFFVNPQDRKTPEKLIYALDANGRYVPVPARFPSAGESATATASATDAAMKLHAVQESTSFAALGSWVHGQGLKFGIHIVRGIPRASVERNLPVEGSSYKAMDVADETDACPWDPTNWGVKNTAAGQAWYDSLMQQYAAWGVDLIKVDCISSHPYKADEIQMIRRAIDKATAKTKHPMVLSLSPGPTALENAAEVGKLAQMWRISDDFWDFWEKPDPAKDYPQGLKAQFQKLEAWQKYTKPGNWPDADMLPLGTIGPSPGYGAARMTRFTQDEQRTLLTLWSIARSPLIVGANLTELDDATEAVLTNPAVVAMDQRGHDQKLASSDENLIAWTTKTDGGKEYLAIFNVSDSAVRVAVPLQRYGFMADKYSARDAWEGKDLGRISEAAGTVAAHGVLLLELKK